MKPRLNSFFLSSAATLAIVTCAHAADFTWDGGSGNWNSTNWNGGTASGPTSAGNTAIINSGTVTANVGGPGNLDSIVIGSGGQLNLYNGDGNIYAYQGIGNLNLQGGTVNGGSATYNAYGASFLGNVTVSGSSASTITGGSWFNIGPSTVFTVADVTGSSATDLLVSTSLRGPAGSPDWTYNAASMIKDGAGTMEMTVHSYFWGGLTLNGGTLKVSGGNGGYGFFSGNVTVNAGTTLETTSDGTGLGWQNGWKPSSVNINGGTITAAGTSHIWAIGGGVNMTGGTLQSNGGVSDPNGGQLEWWQTNVNTNASADTATIGGRIRIRADGGYGGPAFNVANGAAATDLLVSAAINEANGTVGISKSGAGTMVLSGANSYAGGTAVNEGTLTFANTSAKPSAGTTTVAAGATLGLRVGGAGYFNEADVTSLFGNTMTNVSMNATSNVGVDTSTGNFSYTASATGSRGLVKLGSNTLTLTAINSYSGGTIVNSGTLELNSTSNDESVIRGTLTVNSGATVNITGYDYAGLGRINGANVTELNVNGGTVNTSVESWLTGATVNLTGGTMNGTGRHQIISSSLNSKASATTSTISTNLLIRKDFGSSDLAIDVEDGAAATDLLISGSIGQVNSAAVAKTGAGTLVLSGSSTYDGATTVSAGTLLVTGALSNSAVSVNGGAFGGTGTVGSSLTITSGLFHVANLFDALDVAGTVSLFAGFGIDDLAGLNWDSVADGTYTLINGTLGPGVFAGLSHNSLGSAFHIGGGRSAYFKEGSLQLVVIPEPGAALIGGLGVLCLLRRRR